MELTQKDIKFLTIMNETRLSEGKICGRYSQEVNKEFLFSDSELNAAVKKFVKMGMLSTIEAGGGETVYFHTEKVDRSKLDKDLRKIRH